MCALQNPTRSISIGEAFLQGGSSGDDNKNDVAKSNIRKANTADLLGIINNYGIKIDKYNKKHKCPFPHHKMERTASFTFYPDTNSFYCFGCKSGGGPVDFISLMEGISKQDASIKIIDGYVINSDADIDTTDTFINRQKMTLEFSDMIRNFIQNNSDDSSALKYIEKVCSIFDKITQKHHLDNDGLRSVIDKLKIKLDQYKCQ